MAKNNEVDNNVIVRTSATHPFQDKGFTATNTHKSRSSITIDLESANNLIRESGFQVPEEGEFIGVVESLDPLNGVTADGIQYCNLFINDGKATVRALVKDGKTGQYIERFFGISKSTNETVKEYFERNKGLFSGLKVRVTYQNTVDGKTAYLNPSDAIPKPHTYTGKRIVDMTKCSMDSYAKRPLTR